jgi:exodeoxyribonuclease V alpha subunit
VSDAVTSDWLLPQPGAPPAVKPAAEKRSETEAPKRELVSRFGKVAVIGLIEPQTRANKDAPHRLTVDGREIECHAKRKPDDLRDRGMTAICIGEFSRVSANKFNADIVIEGRSDTQAGNLLDIHDFLTDIVDGPSKAFDILDEFGVEAKAIVTENPYRIAEVEGVGFKTADKAAKAIWGAENFDRYRPERLAAALAISVQEQSLQTGSTVVSRVAAVNTAMGPNFLDLPQLLETRMRVEATIPTLIANERLAHHAHGAAPHVGLTRFLHSEKTAAKIVNEKLRNHHGLFETEDEAADVAIYAARQSGFSLTPSQQSALGKLLTAPVGVMTGGPGVGKTTVTKIYCDVQANEGKIIALVAPTGRAAQRLGEATGRPASTIHRAFQVGPGGKARVNAGNPLEVDVLVVDEASMLDAGLARVILNGVKPECHVLFVGDVDQLPAIMPGNVLSDLLNTPHVPRARLTEVMRQAEGSDIIRAARQFNAGKGLPKALSGENDFLYVEARTDGEALELARKLLTDVFPAIEKKDGSPVDLTRDVQILCTHNDKGEISRWNVAQVFARTVNPSIDRGKLRTGSNAKTSGFANPDEMIGVGDKVICLKNDYELGVMNGEIGIVRDFTTDRGDIETIAVEFDSSDAIGDPAACNATDDDAPPDPRRILTFKGKTLKNITAAGAITVHKSQGSQFPCVIVLVPRSAGGFVSRRLVYTAMTRAKEFLAVIGVRDALDLASREMGAPRVTTLQEQLMVELMAAPNRRVAVNAPPSAPLDVSDPSFDTDGARYYLCADSPLSKATMERWRQTGTGPEFIRLGGVVRYRQSALERYLDARTNLVVRGKNRRPEAAE